MKLVTHSHNSAEKSIPVATLDSVREALRAAQPDFDSTTKLRKDVLGRLTTVGWSGETQVDAASKITVTGMNDKIALCLQTGNVGRFYADILKLECLFRKGSASAAIYILFAQPGANRAYFRRSVDELMLFAPIITMPIFVIGVSGDKK